MTYSYVDATFQSSFEVNAGSNSTADANGNILVRPGDRIPLIPRHAGRFVLDYELTKQWNIGANLVLVSGSFLHGDENNANRAGGTNGQGATIQGSGWIPGYAVVNLQSTVHVAKAHRCLRASRQSVRQGIRNGRIPHRQCVQPQRFLPLQSQCLEQ